MSRVSPEEALEEAKENTYQAHHEWVGPDEAQEHLMQAIAHLAYAEAMWMVWSEKNIEESQG